VRELAGVDGGIVSLGFLHSLGATVVPHAIREHRRNFDRVDFELHQRSGRQVIANLASGVTDLCVSVPGLFVESLEVTWEPLYTEELFIVVPRGHRFATRTRLRFAELAAEPFVALDTEHTLRHVFDAVCARAGVTPRIAFEGTDIETLRGLVGGGLGIDLVDDASRIIAVGWVTDRYLSPAAVAFRHSLHSAVSEPSA
jgi:LysR family transcriptional activator of glutamate synthase operon